MPKHKCVLYAPPAECDISPGGRSWLTAQDYHICIHVHDIIYKKHLNLDSPLSESVWGGFLLKIQILYRNMPLGAGISVCPSKTGALEHAVGRWNPCAPAKLGRWNMPWGAGIRLPQ